MRDDDKDAEVGFVHTQTFNLNNTKIIFTLNAKIVF